MNHHAHLIARGRDAAAAALPRAEGLTRRSALFGAVAGAATLTGGLAGPRMARAADYKALVCIFLYGGNDGMNMVVPTDAERYAQYSAVRGTLAIANGALRPLPGTAYGLHPALAPLDGIAAAGQLAAVLNVGTLRQPLTKDAYRAAVAGSVQVPTNLFSHSDQQAQWAGAQTAGAIREGWAGRAAEVLATVNPVISLGGNALFGTSNARLPFALPEPGASFGVVELGSESWRSSWAPAAARAQTLKAIYAAPRSSSILREAHRRIQQDAFGLADRFGPILKMLPGDASSNAAVNAGFASQISGGKLTTPLAAQLYQIAKLIAYRSTVGCDRQVYFAQLGGFDTHSNQGTTTGTHAAQLKQLAGAMAAFQAALVNLGIADGVVTFTHSDFGRTFKPNASGGTDHAWGSHHLVMGAPVKGQATYGSYPDLTLGGPSDVGTASWEQQGRWIPTSSVDQYAATLLGWLGASEAQLDQILPNLVNFGAARRLGFV